VDLGGVKRIGKGESIWVIIHISMGITQELSLCSYPYLKVAKISCFLFYVL
jgi:hypothetical protein